jgi:hypothetical protein
MKVDFQLELLLQKAPVSSKFPRKAFSKASGEFLGDQPVECRTGTWLLQNDRSLFFFTFNSSKWQQGMIWGSDPEIGAGMILDGICPRWKR